MSSDHIVRTARAIHALAWNRGYLASRIEAVSKRLLRQPFQELHYVPAISSDCFRTQSLFPGYKEHEFLKLVWKWLRRPWRVNETAVKSQKLLSKAHETVNRRRIEYAHPFGLPIVDPNLSRSSNFICGYRAKIREVQIVDYINQLARCLEQQLSRGSLPT